MYTGGISVSSSKRRLLITILLIKTFNENSFKEDVSLETPVELWLATTDLETITRLLTQPLL